MGAAIIQKRPRMEDMRGRLLRMKGGRWWLAAGVYGDAIAHFSDLLGQVEIALN